MNKKFTIYMIIILMVILFSGLGIARTVYAETLDGVMSLNEKSTSIQNKYKITGEILKLQKNSDSMTVLTKDGLFYVINGKTKKYTFKGSIMDTASFYQSGQDIFVSPILQTDSNKNKIYLEYKINLEDNSNKVSTNYSDYMDKINLMWEPDSITTFTDADNNKWFATFYNFSTKFYELFRIDTKGNIREIMNTKNGSVYRAFDDLSYDLNKNVYFTYSVGNGINVYGDGKGNESRIISVFVRVDKNLKQTSFEFYGAIDDYVVSPGGDIWALSGKKALIHFDSKGKRLATIPLKNGKDISMETGGSVYVLDDNIVKSIYRDKLYTKYTLNSTYRYNELSMITKDSLIAANENTFEIIGKNSSQIVISDSAVKYNPYIVKDNKGNITILSKNIYTQSDTDLKVYQIGNKGISFHNVKTNLGDYSKAVGYDGTIYIPYKDDYDITINLLKSDMKTEKFITVTAFLPLINMEMDSKKNLYILTNQSLMNISPSKKILSTDITDEKGGYNSQILGFIKDKYNNLYIKYQKNDYNSRYDIYGLLKINDNMDIKPVKLTSGDRDANLIFVTSRNEVAMINEDATNGRQLYTVDSKGNVVKGTSYNGKSYYKPGLVSQLQKIWKTSDGTYFYEKYLELFKKSTTDEIWLGSTNQVVGDGNGSLYYTDYSNVYIYDKQLPKVITTSPGINQTKISVDSKITLQISEPVMKGTDFNKISVSANGYKVSAGYTLVDNKIVIIPKTKLKSKVKYKVTIPVKAVNDIAGNSLSNEYNYTFTTK